MVTTTTQYSFQKPTVGDDEDAWGGYLNSNFDSIDSLLRGATSLSAIDVTGTVAAGGLTVETSGDPAALIRNTSTGTVSLTLRRNANDDAYTDWTFDNTGGDLSIISDDTARPNATRIKMTYDGDISFYEDTGTTAKFFWDASAESLGIGTTAPDNTLHLFGTSATPSLRFGSTSALYYWDIGRENATSGDFIFNQSINGSVSERMRITSAGDVGIGTSSPIYAVDIKTSGTNNGQLRVGGGSTSATGLLFEQTNSGTTTANIQNSYYSTSASASLSIKSGYTTFHTGTSGTERMRISSDGNVGIGGTSPNYPLEVRRNSTTNYASSSTSQATPYVSGDSVMYIANASSATNRGAFLSLGSTDAWGVTNLKYLGVVSQTGSYGGNFVIGGRTASSAYSEHFRIDSSGKVIINGTITGSTDYADLLTLSNTTGRAGMTIRSANTLTGSIFFSDVNATSGSGAYAGYLQYQHDTNAMVLGTSSTERMRIDSNGNVGVGTSSPSSYQNYTYFDVVGKSTTQGGIFKTYTSDGSTQSIYYTTGTEAILGTTTNHPFVFTSNNSERMRISNTGNVGIGTTSPSEKLSVHPDSDNSAEIGRAHVGYIGYGDFAGFSHVDTNGTGSYALLQSSGGNTYVNAATGRLLYLRNNNNTVAEIAFSYASFHKPLYNYSVYYEDYDALSGTSVTVNCDTAQGFSLTLSGNTTFTFNSVTSAWSYGFVLELTGHSTTAYTIDFGTNNNVKWAGGTAPDAPAAGETDIYVFWTRDGGTTWYGVHSIDAAS